MLIKSFVTDIFGSNLYIVSQNNSAIIIDSSGSANFYQKVQDYIDNNGLDLKAVLLTHGHFDHIALGHLYQGKTPIYIHKADSHMLYTDKNYAKMFRYAVKPFKADVLLEGDEQLDFGGIKVQVIHTPGHSPGSVCYVIDNNIFSGDTLFQGDIGRTDLEGGDYDQIIQSIQKLFLLKGDYNVYPGHGEPTTLRYEQKNNPYV